MKKLLSKATLRTMTIIAPLILIELVSAIVQKPIPSPSLRILVGILALVLAIGTAIKINQLTYNFENTGN